MNMRMVSYIQMNLRIVYKDTIGRNEDASSHAHAYTRIKINKVWLLLVVPISTCCSLHDRIKHCSLRKNNIVHNHRLIFNHDIRDLYVLQKIYIVQVMQIALINLCKGVCSSFIHIRYVP